MLPTGGVALGRPRGFGSPGSCYLLKVGVGTILESFLASQFHVFVKNPGCGIGSVLVGIGGRRRRGRQRMRWLDGITDSMDVLEVFVGGRRETLVSLAFCRGP